MKSSFILVLVIVKVAEGFNTTLEDGSTYIGELDENNLPTGQGKLLYVNGDIYE